MSQHDRFLAFMIMFTLLLLVFVVAYASFEDSRLEARIKSLEVVGMPYASADEPRGAWESDYIPTPCPCCEEAKP